MKITFPRLPRPSWPRRERAPEPAPAPGLAGSLRVFRAAALWGIALVVTAASAASFTESYRGLLLWAGRHGLSGFWAAAFPAQVDSFIVVGELCLFVAMADRWRRRDRAGAWAVALLGLAVSVAGNVGHAAGHDLQARGTAAIPPLAAFAAMWVGLSVLKHVVSAPAAAAARTAPAGSGDDETSRLAETLDGLAEAVRVLGERAADPVPASGGSADETALLGELLEAVRDVGTRIGGMDSVPVPTGVEHAALIAYRATVQAGNPYSMNALQVRFGLTRSQVAKIRASLSDEFGPHLPGDVNGHQLEGAAGAGFSAN